jgi:hypothetical protein
MAIPILNHMDFQKSAEIRNVRLHNQAASGVTSPGTGQILYDSGTVKFYNGSSWVALGTGSGSGTVTSVAIAGTDGIQVDSGSPITSSGTITLGLNAIPNSKLANSSITLNQGAGMAALGSVSLGGNIDVAVDGVLEDLDTLGAPSSDGQVIVATGAGAFAYESGATLRSSIGVDAAGTDNSTDVTLNTSSYDYLSISGQAITLGAITNDDLAGSIANGKLANSSVTIGGTAVSLGGTITALTALTDLDVTSGNKTILDGVGSNTLTIGASGTTIAIPGDLVVTGTTTTNNVETVSTSNGVIFEGSAADANELTLLAGSLSADRTVTLPDATGTVVLADATQTLTNKTIAASQVTEISNLTAGEGAQLENINSVTISNAQWGYLGSATAFGGSLLDDADAAAARTTLGVDAAGTDNSTDVSLAGSLDYITISGQTITRNAIVLTTDVSGTLPIANGGTGATSAANAFNALKQAATTSATGVVELATSTEAKNGSGSGKVIDASQLASRSIVATIDVSDSTFTSNLYAEIDHGLQTEDVIVQLFDSSTKETVFFADVARTDKSGSASTSKIKITFAAAPSNDIEVMVTSIKGAGAGTVAYS